MELIAIFIIAGIALVVFAFSYSAKQSANKRKKEYSAALDHLAATWHLTWQQKDIDLHRAMAWDQTKRALAFIDGTKGAQNGAVIMMDEVSGCQLYQNGSTASIRQHSKGENSINSIELQLFFKDRERPPLALPFFSELLDGTFEKITQSEKANHWLTLISPSLNR